MARQLLKLESLSDLDDGRVSIAFNKALAEIARDLHDRPTDKTARTLTLKLSVKPIPAGEVLAAASVEFEIYPSIPRRRTRPYEVAPHASGVFVFNDASPDDSRQGTLDELGGEKETG